MKYWNMRLDCLCHSLLAHAQSSSHLTAQNQALSCPHTRCWAHLPPLDSPGPFNHTWGLDRVLPHTAKSANIFLCVTQSERGQRTTAAPCPCHHFTPRATTATHMVSPSLDTFHLQAPHNLGTNVISPTPLLVCLVTKLVWQWEMSDFG